MNTDSFKQIQSVTESCIHIEDDLALKICCAKYQGVSYKVTLNYSPRNDEHIWKMDETTFGLTDTIENSLGMKFNLISAGTFMMGSPSTEIGRQADETQHQVTLSKSFYMQTTEVTQEQWEAVMGNKSFAIFEGCRKNCPIGILGLWWDNAQAFIAEINQRGEGVYRLPTEAEWEYAARAGTSTAFANGDIAYTYREPVDPNLDMMGWYWGNSALRNPGDFSIHPVAQKQPNAWGLYDMHGNVSELVQDWYGDYPSGSLTDPVGPNSGLKHVVRGGSYSSLAKYCRSASRMGDFLPVGFRLVHIP